MEPAQSAPASRPIDRFLLRILYDQDLRLKLEYGCSDAERLNKFVELGRMANFDIRPKDLLNKFGVKADDENAGHLVVSGRGTDELTVEWRTPEGSPLPTAIHLQKSTLVEDSFQLASQSSQPGFDEREALFATVWLAAYADERISPPELDEIQAAGVVLFGSEEPEEIENRLYDLLHSEGPEGIAKRILHVASSAGTPFRTALFRAAIRVVKSDEKIVVPESKFLKALGMALQLNAIDDERYIHLADSRFFYAFNFSDALAPLKSRSESFCTAAAFFLAVGERTLLGRDAEEIILSWTHYSGGPNPEPSDIEALRNLFLEGGCVGLARACKSGVHAYERMADAFVAGMLFARRYSDKLWAAFSTMVRGVGEADKLPDTEAVDHALRWVQTHPSKDGTMLMGTTLAPPLARSQHEVSEMPAVDEKYYFIAATVGLVVCAYRFSDAAVLETPTEAVIISAATQAVPELKRPQTRVQVLQFLKLVIQNFGPKGAAVTFYRYLEALHERAPDLSEAVHKIFGSAWQAGVENPVPEAEDFDAEHVYYRLFETLGINAPDDENGVLPSRLPESARSSPHDSFFARLQRSMNPPFLDENNDDEDDEDDSLEPIDALTAFFERRSWMIKVDYDDPGVHTTYAGNNGQFNCFAKLRIEQSQLVFYSIFPIRTPPDKRQLMAELITRANFGMVIGNFELDFNDGEVRYKSSVDFEGIGLMDKMLENLIHANILTMDRYLSGLYALIYSDRNPIEIIEEIESGSRP